MSNQLSARATSEATGQTAGYYEFNFCFDFCIPWEVLGPEAFFGCMGGCLLLESDGGVS